MYKFARRITIVIKACKQSVLIGRTYFRVHPFVFCECIYILQVTIKFQILNTNRCQPFTRERIAERDRLNTQERTSSTKRSLKR